MSVETFTSERQRLLFEDVLQRLEGLGYHRRSELLALRYEFPDWFVPETPLRVAPAAAFARTPQSYDSACFAVLLANGKSGAELIADYRALGAPFAFEIREDSVAYWKVRKEASQASPELRILPEAVDRVFKDNAVAWRSKELLRVKNAGIKLGPEQGDLFVDSGLIPALEKQIETKLSALLHGVIAEVENAYQQTATPELSDSELFKLVFTVLTAKVFHDRGYPSSGSLPEYWDEPAQPLFHRSQLASNLITKALWKGVNFRNLSVEVLAYIYENTLVNDESRRILSTHSTPHPIARYIVNHLPFEKITESEPLIIEPFSGHGIFLVAALQRLRDRLPDDMNAVERHRYFVKRLRGYELDPFAIEVSRLCLMLADFPNRNGWQLSEENVFSSTQFAADLRKAGVVLCNPPFEGLIPGDPRRGGELRSVFQPAEFMHRVLDGLSPSGMLGLVLPRTFLDGVSYRELRELLARRFDEIETVGLPDKVFQKSQQESALLIAKAPRRNRTTVAVTYTHVADKDRKRFLSEYAFTHRDSESKSFQAARESLAVVALREIWSELEACPKLTSIADIHRGVEWEGPLDERNYTSALAKPGFAPGVLKARHNKCFKAPQPIFLNTEPEHQRGNAWRLPWKRAKAVVNAVRASRGPWRLAAFGDDAGLIFSQNFTALWLRNHWTPKTLAAVLNGPVANAFVHAYERGKHNRKETLEQIPVPELGLDTVKAIDGLVDRYLDLVRPLAYEKELPLLGSESHDQQKGKETLLEIDATVLKAYSLPPRMERDLLDFFRDAERPVPFLFTEFYSESFIPAIPLWMYISEDFKNCTGRYFLEHAPDITDPALIEALKEVE
jgi:type I restriction-modification system DNA methylase subunit